MAGAKRRRRFGNVRKLPSARWQARYLGPDGVMRTAPQTFATERQAEKWLTVVESEILRGEWVPPEAGEIRIMVIDEYEVEPEAVPPETPSEV